MKTKKKLVKVVTLFILSIFIVACSGEDGAMGPAGPKGEQGAQGPQGETGSANVIYSDWINNQHSNNIIATSSSFTVDASGLTQNILDNGVILVYGRRNSNVYQLPIVFGASRQQSYYFRATVGEIRFSVAANEEGDPTGDGTFFSQYRYVLIPGGQQANKNEKSLNYSEMSYEEIAKHFNIPN